MMNIKLSTTSDHFYWFMANWIDEDFRYHVWIDVLDDRKTVVVGDTIYKNPIEHVRGSRTKALDIHAKAHADVKARITRLATAETLLGLFDAAKAAREAFDAMRAEAERLNAIHDAWKLLATAKLDELEALGFNGFNGYLA